jgi:N-acetylglucosaminyl-diphospho-decaprenol L-rhamnosyltransferase
MTTPPSVAAIIVSFRTRGLLRACLRSLAGQQGVECEVWVVDNASDDGSADMVAAEFPDVHLLRSAENLGFARANNLALTQATGDLLALINPDTELPPDALATAAAVAARNPEAGMVGLALRNPDGSPQASCFAFPGLANLAVESVLPQTVTSRLGLDTASAARPPRGGEGRVDWVSGAFMAMTRAAYDRVRGLDEDLFMYGEEMDWSWRARAAGFDTVHSDRAIVLHHGGAAGVGQQGALFVRAMQARLAFLRRHRGAWRAALAPLLILLGASGRLVLWEARSVIERAGGGVRPYTASQRDRFRAVVGWCLRGAR